MYEVSVKVKWSSAHRLMFAPVECKSIHGHNYEADIVVSANQLDAVGQVIPFETIKDQIGAYIEEHMGHTVLLQNTDNEVIKVFDDWHERLGLKAPFLMNGAPTAENLAKLLYDESQNILGPKYTVARVTVHEMDGCSATYAYSGGPIPASSSQVP